MLKANYWKKVLLIVLLVSIVSNLAGAQAFRFTVSADNRPLESQNALRWEWLLDEMTDKVGDAGVFHIMPGDFDEPEYTDASLTAQFGEEVVWYPVVGNHETETPADMEWIRNAYYSLPYIVNEGPAGCETTTYSWDYGNAHFVAINQYYNGVSDTGAGGDVMDALYDWLVADLEANTQPFVFIIGHEPAYPEYRHVGDSLDQHPARRDRFWKLLNDEQVVAYFCGHTHTYYAKQVDGPDWEPFTWQVDCGNSGNGSPNTFVDVTVTETAVIFNTWQGTQNSPFTNIESWTVGVPYKAYRPKPADGAVHFETWATLSWTAGAGAALHDVYFGENFDDVNDGTGDSSGFGGNQAEASFAVGSPESAYPQGFVPGVTYYWRVDEVNELDPNSPWKGDVWSFTTGPGYATEPDPANNDVGAALDATLSWLPGLTAATHDVYFGTSSPPPFIGNQEDPNFDPNGLEPKTTYYWQVDEIEPNGTTIYTGDIWSFKTAMPNAGVKAEYYHWNYVNPPEAAFETLVLTRVDSEIDFDWGDPGSPDPLVNVNNFSAKWLASFEAPYSEAYTFWTQTDDGVLLWLDGELIIYSWFDQSAIWAASAPIELTAGQRHTIEMWYFERGGNAVARLHWESPTIQPRQVIPRGLLQLPLMALEPDPADGATNVPKTPTLSWTQGVTAATHNVYFSADQQAVTDSNAFIVNQAETSYSPSGLVKGTTYYWRVDEVEADSTTTHTGDVWSFMTAPGYATRPDPANNAVAVVIDATLSWSPGFTAATHDVYFGPNSPPAFIGNQETASYYPGPLEPVTTYYWQIDEIEADGTTKYTGDIWSFKTHRPGTGTILYEVWVNVGFGSAISDLTGNENYPHSPIFSTEVMSFEAWTDITDAFGARLHGYLHPETSGDYTFWIASDDNGELWLSTDESPGNAVLIAGNTGWTNPRQWDKFPEQQSDPISLVGGEKYYIMALYKEGWNTDNCAVAWEGPDSPTRAVIAGHFLSPYMELRAMSPDPADGTTEVKRTPTLSWTAGGNTASVNGHELYLSIDVNAVNDRIAEKVVLSEPIYSITTKLDTGKTYYWCVDEVDADGITRHIGDVWSFTVTTIAGRG